MLDTAPVQKNSSSSKTYWIVVSLVSAFSVWLRTGFPLTAMPVFYHDDHLFVSLARSLEAGHWLGPYDNLTLAKGMFYPVFIVISSWTSIPLKVAEQIVYLGASALAAGVVRRIVGGNRLSLLLFVALAFNPVVWNPDMARVLRQGLYLSLCLAMIALVVVLAFPPAGPKQRSFVHVDLPAISLGLISAAYWLTREEGVWLLPAIFVVLAIAVTGIFWPPYALATGGAESEGRAARMQAIARPLILAVAVFIAADFAVAGLNYHYYGIFETSEMRAKSFVRAYGALSRIKHDTWRPLITFPKDARQRAYAVSAAAREIQPYMEGATGDRWLQITCNFGAVKPCDEVQAGWLMWEFRDAVADAGHYRTGADAMRYYKALADQIDHACDTKAIPCLPARTTLQPPFRWEYLHWTYGIGKKIAPIVFQMKDGPIGSAPSAGTTQDLAYFSDIMDGIYLPEIVSISARGWTAASAATPAIQIENRAATPFDSSITLSPSPDVVKVYPNLKSIRFELKTNCPIDSCDLVLDVAGSGKTKVPFSKMLHPGANAGVVETPSLMLYLDNISGLDSFAFSDARRNRKVKVAEIIASLYSGLIPFLAAFGAVGLLLATFFRRRFPLPIALLALGLASAAAVATLIVLMSYLMASSGFNVANVLYTSAASPFLITFAVLGLYSWYAALKSWASRSDRRIAPPYFQVR